MEPQTMSIPDQNGSADSGAASLQQQLHTEHAELFQFAARCRHLALDVAALMPHARATRQIVVSQFFARAVSHFEAAMVLAERGLAIESLTLTRSLVETSFVMLAIAEDAVMPAELIGHDNAMRLRHANALLNSKDYPNVEPFREALESFAAGLAGAKEIGIYEFARRGKALAQYDGLYRLLSNHALHATLSAVDAYLEVDVNGQHHVRYRPLIEKTQAALATACQGVLIACHASELAKVCTAETSAELSSAWAEFVALDAKLKLWV